MFHNHYPIHYNSTNVFAIGGMSCCGKTSTIPSQHYCKVNGYLSIDVKNYNIHPLVAHAYVTQSMNLLNTAQNIIMDRTPLDNLAYQLTYYMMAKDGESNQLSLYGLCHQYIMANQLEPMLEMVTHKFNLLFIIDSNIPTWQERMRQRGTPGDVAKSHYPKYGYQAEAFRYLATRCQIRLFDLDHLRTSLGTESMQILLDHIKTSIHFDESTVASIPPPIERVIDLTYRDIHKRTLQVSKR